MSEIKGPVRFEVRAGYGAFDGWVDADGKPISQVDIEDALNARAAEREELEVLRAQWRDLDAEYATIDRLNEALRGTDQHAYLDAKADTVKARAAHLARVADVRAYYAAHPEALEVPSDG